MDWSLYAWVRCCISLSTIALCGSGKLTAEKEIELVPLLFLFTGLAMNAIVTVGKVWQSASATPSLLLSGKSEYSIVQVISRH